MGALQDILAAVDNAKRVAGRNISDVMQDPEGALTKIVDTIGNFNKGRVAEITPESAGYRTLSPEERVEQVTGGALDNMGGGGKGVQHELNRLKGKE